MQQPRRPQRIPSMSSLNASISLFTIYTLMLAALASSLRFPYGIGIRKLSFVSSSRPGSRRLYGCTSLSAFQSSLTSLSEELIEPKRQNPLSYSKTNDNLWKGQVALAIKTKDTEKIKFLRDEIIASKSQKNINLLANLISACEKASDLPIALQIIKDLKNTSVSLTEATYLPVIRCYSDANNITEAWRYVKLIEKQDKTTIRHRTLQPLFDYCLRAGDMAKALDVYAYMTQDVVLTARSEHIALLLKIYLKLPEESRKKKSHMSKIHDILQRSSGVVWGLAGDDVWDLMALQTPAAIPPSSPTSTPPNTPQSSQQSHTALSQAILVQRAEDLLGAITDESQRADEGLVRAYNASFTASFTSPVAASTSSASNSTQQNQRQGSEGNGSNGASIPAPSVSVSSSTSTSTSSSASAAVNKRPPHLPVELVTVAEEWFILAEERKKILERRAVKKYQDFVRQASAADPTPHLTLKKFVQDELKSMSDVRGSVVCMSPHTPLCPQCQGGVKRLEVSLDERLEVRQAILSTARERGKIHEENLLNFTRWLESRPPFTYIVDAANVAYSHQNYEQGRFNYHQLDLVVRQLQSAGHRVLTILPSCYAPKSGVYVPNSIRIARGKGSGDVGKGRKSKDKVNVNKLTKEDISIISRLLREDSVYLVPSGADDDWYWMTASLVNHTLTASKNSSSSATASAPYVVTNDLMRDHKLSFIAPRPFVRWRAGQIVHFTFAFQDKEIPAKMEDKGSSEEINSEVSPPAKDNENSQSESSDSNVTSPIVPVKAEKVILFPPGNFTREMQYDEKKKRWHIPAVDRNIWLCLEL